MKSIDLHIFPELCAALSLQLEFFLQTVLLLNQFIPLFLQQVQVLQEFFLLLLNLLHLLLKEIKKHVLLHRKLLRNQTAKFDLYLQVTGLGGDDQDVRFAFILHREQFFFCGAVGPELEWGAGPADLSLVCDITELVELTVVVWDVIT